jgi:hypothetical protein
VHHIGPQVRKSTNTKMIKYGSLIKTKKGKKKGKENRGKGKYRRRGRRGNKKSRKNINRGGEAQKGFNKTLDL